MTMQNSFWVRNRSLAYLPKLPSMFSSPRAGLLSLLGALTLLGLILALWFFGWQREETASLRDLRLLAKVLSAAVCFGFVLLLGLLILVLRQRGERARLEAALRHQAAPAQWQTETSYTLAREMDAAQSEVRERNGSLEHEHEYEPELSPHFSVASVGLGRDTIQQERTALALETSRNELELAREELEQNRIAHTSELERSNHELEQFAYVASHDLQEPLRAISGCVEILQLRYAEKIDARGHELIAHTVAGVSRMSELIDDLLEYSRVRRAGAPEPVSVESALAAALRQLESAIENTGALIEHEILPTVCADGSQLVQLLQNLIGNALKYRGKAAPQVKISAQRDHSNWLFAVRDNGIGIEPQYFERIFSIFQRLHTRDEYPGTGIGLALCRRIVEQAGGLIWLDSQFGKGSTFYFTLPAVS